MTAPLLVDPAALAGTGDTVDREGDAVASALDSLSAALSGAGAMFGHDAAGLMMAQSYTESGKAVLHAAASAVNACRRVSFGIRTSASNYGLANANSTVGGGSSPVPPPSAPNSYGAPGMPSPLGSGIAAPLGWALVEAFVGDVWPDGDPAALHAAAAAWRAFGASVSGVAGQVSVTALGLGAQQIPEAGQMASVVGDIGSGLGDVAAHAQAVASAVDGFAETVDATQNAVRGLLTQLSPAGILETVGGVLFGGEDPLEEIRRIGSEIKTVLNNMKREADATGQMCSQGINVLDTATDSLEKWAHKEFTSAFGQPVGDALSVGFDAFVDLPEGAFKFVAETAQGLQQLDPTRFTYDPSGAAKSWEGMLETTAVAVNPVLLASAVASDPQGSLGTVEGLVDWKDVEAGHPFRAVGYDTAQVASLFIPGVGEAEPAIVAGRVEGRVAATGAEAESRVAAGASREGLGVAGAASATDGVAAQAGRVGSQLDGLKVPESTTPAAGPGSSAPGGRPPVEVPTVNAPIGHSSIVAGADESAPGRIQPHDGSGNERHIGGVGDRADPESHNPSDTDRFDYLANDGVSVEQLPDLTEIDREYRNLDGAVDPNRVEEWAERVSDAYPRISPEGVEGIYDYSTEQYQAINPYLRNIEPLDVNQQSILGAESIADLTPERRAMWDAQINRVDDGLASLPPHRADPADMTSTTWRGMHAPSSILDRLNLGDIFRDPGYFSTSTNQLVAEQFAWGATADTVPTLIRVIGEDGVDISPLSRYVDEAEILFPRSSAFEVVAREMDADGLMRITLRQVVP